MSLIFVVEAGEMLHVAEAFLDKSYHPTVICRGKMLLVFYEIKDTLFFLFFIVVCHLFLFMIMPLFDLLQPTTKLWRMLLLCWTELPCPLMSRIVSFLNLDSLLESHIECNQIQYVFYVLC